MRVLGIETSSTTGSVALVDGDRLVCALHHDEALAHGERMLPLVERVLAEAGWARSGLERVAVGLGPGSFTGIRVGIALAQGIAVGLGIPLFGVGSLRAMAGAVPPELSGSRVAILDARRGDVFAAGYAPDGAELLAPELFARTRALAAIAERVAAPVVLVGVVAAELDAHAFRSPGSDLPHARFTASIAARIVEEAGDVQPLYVRPPDLVLPKPPPP